MARSLTVAAAQTGSVGDGASERARMADTALAVLDDAARQGVELLTFSELFMAPFFPNRLEEAFDRWFMRSDDPLLEALRERASAHRIALVLPFAERAAAGYFNAAQVQDRDGRVAGHYRKTHIPAYFPAEGPGGTGSYEKFYFTPGDRLEAFDAAGTRIGVQICNDRLYPEGSRVLALQGAALIVMPICYSTYADPAHRESIWEVPLRARAYENGAFVLACNRVGVEGVRHHLGRSMVVDPRGGIVAQASTADPELLVARIDLDDVTAARKRFPWWRDRRPDLYGPLAGVA
jgi:N-carbamoylputrescine amidase